jgi:hypothetical protein
VVLVLPAPQVPQVQPAQPAHKELPALKVV